MSDTDEEDGRGEGDRWLMKQLPRLPHFSVVLPRISHLLLQACLMETSLRSLVSFLLFITSHTPNDLIFEFSIGISQIVVDRFAIIKRVFPATNEVGVASVGVAGAESMHGSLLKMLRVSLETAINSQRIPQVSESSDFVLVTFPSGKKTILHTALIHATLLLLTHPPPHSSPASQDFNFLSDLWLSPEAGGFPEAQSVEEKEATPLITAAILPEMLLSRNPGVVGLCLRDAGLAEICESVCQVGIPVDNMRQILTHLDALCTTSRSTRSSSNDDEKDGDEKMEVSVDLEKAVRNPVQLAQFTEIQLARCGSGEGRKFLSLVRNLGGLPDNDPLQSVSDLLSGGVKEREKEEEEEMEVAPISPSQEAKSDFFAKLTEEKIEQVLVKTFAPSVGRGSLSQEEMARMSSGIEGGLRGVIQLTAALPAGSEERERLALPARAVVVALHRVVVVKSTGRGRRQLLEGMMKSTFAVSLLRLLTRIQDLRGDRGATETELLRATVKQISDSLATMKFGKVKELPRFQAVVRSCSVRLGMKTVPERESYSEKVAKVAGECTAGIRGERDLFGPDQAKMISDICHFVGTEKKSPHFETVLSALVRRSIASGSESQCVELLEKLSWRCRPIALCHSPEVFSGVCPEEGERGLVSTSRQPFVQSLDMSGLKVDLLEMLDPEVMGEVTKREVFGWSEFGEDCEGVRGRGWLGPGYMMARLVHESSWRTLHVTVRDLLEEKACQDDR